MDGVRVVFTTKLMVIHSFSDPQLCPIRLLCRRDDHQRGSTQKGEATLERGQRGPSNFSPNGLHRSP